VSVAGLKTAPLAEGPWSYIFLAIVMFMSALELAV
jgi:hypothetical protein